MEAGHKCSAENKTFAAVAEVATHNDQSDVSHLEQNIVADE